MNTEEIRELRDRIRLGIIDGCLQIISADDVSTDNKLKAVIMLNDAYSYYTDRHLKGEDHD